MNENQVLILEIIPTSFRVTEYPADLPVKLALLWPPRWSSKEAALGTTTLESLPNWQVKGGVV